MRPRLRYGVFVLATAGMLCFGTPAAEQRPDAAAVEIRFGVIEPPVVAQQDITVRAPTSNQQPEAKPLECSGLAWHDGHLLISSDRHEHLVFVCPVNLETMVIGTPEPKIIIHNEQHLVSDAESLTVRHYDGRTTLFMMGSLSNAPDGRALPHRRHLFAAELRGGAAFEVVRSNVLSAGTLRRQLEPLLDKIGLTPYYAYYVDYPGIDKNTYRWGNVEGITFTPDGQTLLCGMRNPLHRDKAVLFAVSGVPDAARWLEPDLMAVTDVFALDLGERGVSDLAWDSVTQGFLITAAKSSGPRLDPDIPYPPNTLDSALFWWSGHKDDAPILIARLPDMTIEAVCRLGTSRYIVLGSDEGDISEGRVYRQSVLTIMEFSGIHRRP